MSHEEQKVNFDVGKAQSAKIPPSVICTDKYSISVKMSWSSFTDGTPVKNDVLLLLCQSDFPSNALRVNIRLGNEDYYRFYIIQKRKQIIYSGDRSLLPKKYD